MKQEAKNSFFWVVEWIWVNFEGFDFVIHSIRIFVDFDSSFLSAWNRKKFVHPIHPEKDPCKISG